MLFLLLFSLLEYEYQNLYGSKWMLIFYHDSSGGVLFQNTSHALSSSSAQQFSFLGSIKEDMKIGGKYEFLLEYPGYSGYSRWRQTKNPVLEAEVSGQIADGYEAVSITWTNMYWGGLVRSYQSTNTLLDGSAGKTSYWYYSIGALKTHDFRHVCFANDCFPGFVEGKPFQKVKLWMKVLQELNTPYPTPHKSFGCQSPHQTLFPEPTPHQSLFPELTPHQSFFPAHTPFHTQNPQRTNQRSFPVDFNERTPSISDDQSNNIFDDNKSNSVFMYSTVGMFMIIVAMISYNLGSKNNMNEISPSSSEIEKKQKREKNRKKDKDNDNESKRYKKKNHLDDDNVSSPYYI